MGLLVGLSHVPSGCSDGLSCMHCKSDTTQPEMWDGFQLELVNCQEWTLNFFSSELGEHVRVFVHSTIQCRVETFHAWFSTAWFRTRLNSFFGSELCGNSFPLTSRNRFTSREAQFPSVAITHLCCSMVSSVSSIILHLLFS